MKFINYVYFAKTKDDNLFSKTFDLQNGAWETSHEKSILKFAKCNDFLPLDKNKERKQLRTSRQVSAES